MGTGQAQPPRPLGLGLGLGTPLVPWGAKTWHRQQARAQGGLEKVGRDVVPGEAEPHPVAF